MSAATARLAANWRRATGVQPLPASPVSESERTGMFSGSIGSTHEGFRFAPVCGRSAWAAFMTDCTFCVARCMSVP